MTFTAAPTPDCSRGTDGDDSGALPSKKNCAGLAPSWTKYMPLIVIFSPKKEKKLAKLRSILGRPCKNHLSRPPVARDSCLCVMVQPSTQSAAT
jgi:hypothetical protein